MPVYYDPKDAYSKGLADAFVRDAAVQNISAVAFEFPKDGLPDQAGMDVFADSPAPDGVFISGTHLDVARIAKFLREAGHKLPLLTGSAAYSQELLTAGGAAVEGLTMLTTFHASIDLENSKAFTKGFQARYGGGTPNARAAQAYDSTRALLEAIRRAKTVDRAGVKAALEGFAANPPAGVTSKLAFSKGGIVGRPLVIIEVKNGKLVAMFIPLLKLFGVGFIMAAVAAPTVAVIVYAIGQAAVHHFIEGSSLESAREVFENQKSEPGLRERLGKMLKRDSSRSA